MELLREDIKNIIKKKRFIVMIILTYLGALAVTIYTKVDYWNDETYFFGMYDYIYNIFSWLPGLALIISVYCRKFTRTSIVMVEEKGKNRAAGVLSKFFAGSLILICCHVLMLIVALLLGLCFAAHSTSEQIGMLALRIGIDCLASITCYGAALFTLYIFAFPIIPAIVYLVLAYGAAVFFKETEFFAGIEFIIAIIVAPRVTADTAYTQLLYSDAEVFYFVLFLIHLIVPVLLSMLVFKFKKKERVKKVKKGKKTNDEVVEADGIVGEPMNGDENQEGSF